MDPTVAGVWPGNREWQGLILSDVMELQTEFCLQGWAKDLVNACATEIPPTDAGGNWRDFNRILWAESDGVLAATNVDELEIVTLRGSHSTASIRNIKLGAKSSDDRIAYNGRLKTDAILELHPSLKDPCSAFPYHTYE